MKRSLHAMGVGVAGCALAVVLAPSAGCTGTPRPPMLGGETYDAGAGDAGETLFTEAGGQVPSCTVGVEGGVCACVDQPLLLDPPNLYFVLDRSGSMNDPYSPTSPLSKWGTVQEVIGNLVIALGPRANFGAAVFPDPAQNSCATGTQVFHTVGGDPYPGKLGNTAKALLMTLGHISAEGGTPTAATFQALAPSIEGLPGKTYVILATDGGPNCNGSAMCTATTCTDNMDGIQGCPRGGPPNCCADPSYGGALACLDAQPTIDAVAAIAKAGVPVYVVGLPASEPYANLLDQLAQAGGTARGSEPQYYAASDQAAFSTAMSEIAAKITGTCTLTLDAAPPDPGLVNVFFDGQPLPQAGPNGWSLSGTTVTILGQSCQAILDGAVIDVRVVAGCPTVTR